jgi:cytochrome P450
LLLLLLLLLQFPYAEAVVREALRLYPPATMLSREVKEGGFPLTPQVRAPNGAATQMPLSRCNA